MTLQLRAETPVATLAEFAVVHANNRTALYKREASNEDWQLVTVEQGEAPLISTTLNATGAPARTMNDMVHILVDGKFPATLTSFAPATPVSILRGEAALLRQQAEQRRTDAAYGGEWGDRGASELEKIADAYDHAVDIFEKYGTGTEAAHV